MMSSGSMATLCYPSPASGLRHCAAEDGAARRQNLKGSGCSIASLRSSSLHGKQLFLNHISFSHTQDVPRWQNVRVEGRIGGTRAGGTRTGGKRMGTRAGGTKTAGTRAGRTKSGGSGKSGKEVEKKNGQFYFNITGFPFPLGPFLDRRTIRYEVEPGIWMFEQEQGLGFSCVTTNVRMTVIRLQSGGLWVHAPVAPTTECIRLLNELGAPVEHIILPTFAYEHKIFVGPFSRKYPRAQVWTAPSQWSWPFNLPLPLLGIFNYKDLISEDQTTPWAEEIEQKVVQAAVGIGPFVEVAFLHKRTKTLVVTDACIYIPDKPPEVIRKESLLESAENGFVVKATTEGEVPEVEVKDTEAFRRIGWQRMVLQILFFRPANLLKPDVSFSVLSKRLIVSPVIRTLVFSKAPDEVREWVDSIVTDWKFNRIIPAHFSAPISASPKDFKSAFSFLYDKEEEPAPSFFRLPNFLSGSQSAEPPAEDMKALDSLNEFLYSVGAVSRK